MFYLFFGFELKEPLDKILKQSVIDHINDDNKTFWVKDKKNKREYLGMVLMTISTDSKDIGEDIDYDPMFHRGYFRRALQEINWPETKALYSKDLDYRIIYIEDCEENQVYPNTAFPDNYKDYDDLKRRAQKVKEQYPDAEDVKEPAKKKSSTKTNSTKSTKTTSIPQDTPTKDLIEQDIEKRKEKFNEKTK